MNPDRSSLPAPRPAPELLDDELVVLLDALGRHVPPPRSRILRERVFDRIGRSARASRAFVTVRRDDAPAEAAAPGVRLRQLYRAGSTARRAGEPERVRLVELAPGAAWAGPGDEMRREWLLLRGHARLDGAELGVLDYRFVPAGHCGGPLGSAGGALVYLREAVADGATAFTSRDSARAWDDFAPGLKRRLLWTEGGEASMLYHALPGAAVPRHGHGHDEECLMIEGEVFLDDVLLRRGDYQLAPAGTEHGAVGTDTGGVLFAHGDLELDLLPG